MFVADTQIFTNSGWKRVADISGNDKVLVKNFIGDAEFIQPFALHKKQYDGEVIKLGAKDWSITVTPDHEVVYKTRWDIKTSPAREMPVNDHNRLQRKFKYMFPEDPKKEYIKIWNDFGETSTTISHEDWYKLVGYVLTRGYIYTERKRPMLQLFLDENRVEEEIIILSDVLDRIGVAYHVQYSEKTRPKLVVSSKNTLVARLLTRLGSQTRKTMRLPDKMVYNSSKELTKLLINTILDASGATDKIFTTNIGLIEDLELLGTLGGYGMRHTLKTPAGTPVNKGFTQKDSYILHISAPIALYSIKYVEKSVYSGYVYGLDLFDGQVYIKEGLSPIWTNPK
jgi:hypothetical protein